MKGIFAGLGIGLLVLAYGVSMIVEGGRLDQKVKDLMANGIRCQAKVEDVELRVQITHGRYGQERKNERFYVHALLIREGEPNLPIVVEVSQFYGRALAKDTFRDFVLDPETKSFGLFVQDTAWQTRFGHTAKLGYGVAALGGLFSLFGIWAWRVAKKADEE